MGGTPASADQAQAWPVMVKIPFSGLRVQAIPQGNSIHARAPLLPLREKVASPQQIYADCINLSAPAMTVEGSREAILRHVHMWKS
jgi:hypothetical protein